MGGGLKGHTQTQNNNNGTCGGRVLLAGGVGGGSRSYGLMLMFAFAFGAAVFGVMTLHKLKERRLFNLVLKDKELHLNSLHFHLQVYPPYTYSFLQNLCFFCSSLCMFLFCFICVRVFCHICTDFYFLQPVTIFFSFRNIVWDTPCSPTKSYDDKVSLYMHVSQMGKVII